MADLTAWVRLAKTGASARRLNSLIERFGAPEALFAVPAQELARAADLPESVALRLADPAHAATDAELADMERLGVRLILRGDAGYPRLLAEIGDPPPFLFARGDLQPEDDRAVAVVGSRSASPYGRGVAERLSRDLAAAGFTVVSGFARGIDTHAHRGALAGGGRTIAVLGCGLDVPYPWGNRELVDRVAASGALLSEYPLGAAPEAWRFPARNRIVSGLSLGVVVVEAPRGSGALITARRALDQNREVFAVPGRIDDPRNCGPHALIRDGAKLVETVEDILAEIQPGAAPAQGELPLPPPDLTEEERLLCAMLSNQGKHVDDLILASDLTASQVNAVLMMLEIKGVARRLPGNCYARA